jgi:hypothetical protein
MMGKWELVRTFGSAAADMAAKAAVDATRELETGTVAAMIRAEHAMDEFRRVTQVDLGYPVQQPPPNRYMQNWEPLPAIVMGPCAPGWYQKEDGTGTGPNQYGEMVEGAERQRGPVLDVRVFAPR